MSYENVYSRSDVPDTPPDQSGIRIYCIVVGLSFAFLLYLLLG